ncbi:YgfZ/GcvT domain-containing protein [Pseudomonas kuykendallii]|uniref:Folate-binding protein YgfZ n=1 Tax=Pseudomonas kuykendallii TaxID=1007099 RepID=A0A2W5D3I5_9PSED|nr:folate-binding protein YgfZ [Pseudomonas kuykendallii]PZP26625.1 MAG: folate-binding protein YgfZ [Pseudomonas kuykendallii]
MADSAFFCPLAHEGVIAVRGPDASTFLQGQLTCNLNYLNESHSLGARCTPKGRMLSSFRILPQGDGYLLAMAAELVQPQLEDLKKYAVFSKSKLFDESDAWSRFGLFEGDSALGKLGFALAPDPGALQQKDGLLALRLENGRAELWAPADQASTLLGKLVALLPTADVDAWKLTQIRAGVGQVFGETRETFIPQMINLQAVGGVSFKKGCYTGQEIVARMQYLGKLKRRLQRLAGDADLPAPGTELFSPVHSTSVGEVVLAAHSEDGIELLAVLQEDAVGDGRIHLASSDGPTLRLLDLPYSLDADREIMR